MKVGIGLGSNLGDRLRHLREARAYLLSLSREGWHRASPLYETRPVGCPAGAGCFYNAVLEIEYGGAPRTLLRRLLAYERARGRDRTAGRNTPRTIDLDILYFGEREVCEPGLVIPHPRLADRRFVLVPLATLCPDRVIKGTGRTVRMLLRALPESPGEVRLVSLDW